CAAWDESLNGGLF
nr:immunoglobulin light chain junction region [Macaca mulatta]